ncbi:TIR domain-containing protein [Actinosynnema sp. NPDC053489]|uniref:TIR domain-containing protein n=1 Tax=Actinosynnema sp. NPDC053489 TaxID=3363916 RepID=UPI0037C50291
MSKAGYDAFISCNHAAERAVARALQRTTRRLGRPWYRLSGLRVFHDDTSLPASAGLWSSLEAALRASRTFVPLASPASAASPWLRREVAWWRENRSADRFVIVRPGKAIARDPVAGDFDRDTTTALPEDLRGWFVEEPHWVNLGEDGRHDFRGKAATVAAAIRGIPKDDLLSEDMRQQRRLISLLTGLLVLALVGAATAVWQGRIAASERDRAEQQARLATSRSLAAQAQYLRDRHPTWRACTPPPPTKRSPASPPFSPSRCTSRPCSPAMRTR